MPDNALPVLSPESGLSRYLQEIRKFPLLEAEEEEMLARRWQEHQDSEAAQKLVTSHLRLVAKIAMGYRGYGLPIAEVISEGNVGLMQAVKRFDPDKGFRLTTYAMWWIRASIQDYVLRSWSLVKIGTTAAQKKLFFNLRKAKRDIQAFDEGALRPDQLKTIAERLQVPEKTVEMMDARLSGSDASINAPRGDDDGDQWQDWIADDAPVQDVELADRQEKAQRLSFLKEALTHLNEREKAIITARRLDEPPATLADLSETYGISRERVRQIEIKAFEKMQRAVTRSARETRLKL